MAIEVLRICTNLIIGTMWYHLVTTLLASTVPQYQQIRPLKLVTLNVKGDNYPNEDIIIHDIINQHDLDMLILLETKLDSYLP